MRCETLGRTKTKKKTSGDDDGNRGAGRRGRSRRKRATKVAGPTRTRNDPAARGQQKTKGKKPDWGETDALHNGAPGHQKVMDSYQPVVRSWKQRGKVKAKAD